MGKYSTAKKRIIKYSCVVGLISFMLLFLVGCMIFGYMEKEENVRYIRQESSMTETQREEFLDAFREQDTPTVGFCVMGGIFSEGIDLQNEAVIGVIIVGTGLPQTGSLRKRRKKWFPICVSLSWNE